jgi:hypothetical protein
MRYVWEASNAAAVWGKPVKKNPSDVAISYTHFVVPRYIETFQVDEKILFPNSPALFCALNHPGDANNKRLRLAHKSAQKNIWRKAQFYDCLYEHGPIFRESTHQAILVYDVRARLPSASNNLMVPDRSAQYHQKSKARTFAPNPFSISTKRPPASSPSSVRTSTNSVHDLSTFKDDDDAVPVKPGLERCAPTA